MADEISIYQIKLTDDLVNLIKSKDDRWFTTAPPTCAKDSAISRAQDQLQFSNSDTVYALLYVFDKKGNEKFIEDVSEHFKMPSERC